MDIAGQFQKALLELARRVPVVGQGQWHDPTPCSEWDLHELTNHVVNELRWVPPLLEGRTIEEVGDRFEGDLLADEPVEAYDASAEAVRRALAPLEDLDRSVAVSYGPVPARSYLEHRYIDLVVHGWDLAVATGQDGELPPELAESAYETMSAQREQVRESGAFADEVEVPEDADVQTKLLGLVGRDPARW